MNPKSPSLVYDLYGFYFLYLCIMEKIIGRQEEKDKVMVVDWYKDEQPRKKVFTLIQLSLNTDLPESYDRVAFVDKTNLLINHFVDMAIQGYGWVAYIPQHNSPSLSLRLRWCFWMFLTQ